MAAGIEVKVVSRDRKNFFVSDEKPAATSGEAPQPDAPLKWEEFLQSYPPGSWKMINPVHDSAIGTPIGGTQVRLRTPIIELECMTELCAGPRFFEYEGSPPQMRLGTWSNVFLNYLCRNCRASRKTFAVQVTLTRPGSGGRVVKLGESPPFGPRTPARLIALIGPDRDLFLRGRRSENQGLGIGAFAYYRRVVENQKGRLLEQIAKVARVTAAPSDVIEALEAARTDFQFSRALDAVKPGVPSSLLIDGHNPLTLLHAALSQGLHAQTDSECLELATSIRVVLSALAERVTVALHDQAELSQAVHRLMQPRGPLGAAPREPTSGDEPGMES